MFLPTNRLILRAKLSSAYFDVLLAENGAQALEITMRELPDMILLDVMMPSMDGYEVCQTLKSRPETAHIPVIMVTAHNSTVEKIRGLDAGALDFLSKPINDITLFARVRNQMRVKMMFDELKLRETTSQELGLSSFFDEHNFDTDEHGCVLLAANSSAQEIEWANIIKNHLPVRTITTGVKLMLQ